MLPRLALAVTLAALALPGAAGSQSFDCARAASADETAVCHSPRLSALDTEMATLYDRIERCALMGVRGDTQDGQRAFMARRAACFADTACLLPLYTDRVAELGKVERAIGTGAC